MKFVVSTKSGKAYTVASDEDQFIGKRVGETVKLDSIGLTGFEAVITGGSDKQGFPMSPSVGGPARKKIFTAKAIGFKPKNKGERKRHSVRGNVISAEISQVNMKITKEGSINLEEKFGKKDESKSAEEEMSAKERALKAAAETAGSADAPDAPTKKGRH
jgi:small subunit ribosomal protein S6e